MEDAMVCSVYLQGLLETSVWAAWSWVSQKNVFKRKWKGRLPSSILRNWRRPQLCSVDCGRRGINQALACLYCQSGRCEGYLSHALGEMFTEMKTSCKKAETKNNSWCQRQNCHTRDLAPQTHPPSKKGKGFAQKSLKPSVILPKLQGGAEFYKHLR